MENTEQCWTAAFS